jgi:predicted dehydrogenase
MTIDVLIVGLGRIGMRYDLELDTHYVYTHARAFTGHTAFRLVAGVDADATARGDFERVFRTPAYERLDEALATHVPELVVIALPTDQHAGALERVLECTRTRVVLCEKPLAYDVADARRMVDACAARGVGLFVNYMRRSDPAVVEVARRIAAGALGAPLKAVVWYSKGFLHNGSHFFNLLELWLGPMRDGFVMRSGRPTTDCDSEPDVYATFERGGAVFLAAWEEAYSHYTVELVSSRGRLRYEQEGRRVEWQCAQTDPQFSGYTVLATDAERMASGFDRYQWYVADELAKSARAERAHLCSGADALRTLEAMTEILRHTREP